VAGSTAYTGEYSLRNAFFVSNFMGALHGMENLQKWSCMFDGQNLSMNSVKVLLRLGESLQPAVEEHYEISSSVWEILRRAVVFDDDRAMDEFIRASYSEIREIAKRLISDMDIEDYDADDAIQEVVIRLWMEKDKMRFEDRNAISIRGYLYEMIKHHLLDRQRLSTRKAPLPADIFDLASDMSMERYFAIPGETGEELEAEEVWRIVEEAMETVKLPDSTKRAFTAIYREGKSIHEISEELGLSSNSIYVMLYRARNKLRTEISNRGLFRD
jgi:RNA polymerase sigma factor (sigma-70 family)